MIIAVDAMGGDHAPQEIVKGALQAADEYGVEILLVGDEAAIAPLLSAAPAGKVKVLPASEVVPMGAHPLEAVRKMKDSSIVVGAAAVKDGRADALVSAGSTGAAMAAALLGWGRIKGVERPAIATILPTLQGFCLLLDAGAQADARPSHLEQFAYMGALYAERVLGVANPRVGLLNIGEEETKGNELTVAVHQRLRQAAGINFIGNVEGRDILPGMADVVVCDGFVGNVVLKSIEGVSRTIFGLITAASGSNVQSKLGAALFRPALRQVKKRLDDTEYGGAPLLGVKGVCIISHGSANAKAMKNAVRVAKEAVEHHVVSAIGSALTGRADVNAAEAASAPSFRTSAGSRLLRLSRRVEK